MTVENLTLDLLCYEINFMYYDIIAKKEEAEYWENPQVYLVTGDDEVEAHFVLHNFKATEPLNTPHLKNLKIAGTLKYMVCVSSCNHCLEWLHVTTLYNNMVCATFL